MRAVAVEAGSENGFVKQNHQFSYFRTNCQGGSPLSGPKGIRIAGGELIQAEQKTGALVKDSTRSSFATVTGLYLSFWLPLEKGQAIRMENRKSV